MNFHFYSFFVFIWLPFPDFDGFVDKWMCSSRACKTTTNIQRVPRWRLVCKDSIHSLQFLSLNSSKEVQVKKAETEEKTKMGTKRNSRLKTSAKPTTKFKPNKVFTHGLAVKLNWSLTAPGKTKLWLPILIKCIEPLGRRNSFSHSVFACKFTKRK